MNNRRVRLELGKNSTNCRVYIDELDVTNVVRKGSVTFGVNCVTTVTLELIPGVTDIHVEDGSLEIVEFDMSKRLNDAFEAGRKAAIK